ncbi:hypothetical protein GHT06_007136 [Daphnia sinensis]|uniref:Uncharacterized protein n=1 Tax=Daphnia sinensis TaxID=1820382 RepID=A0AAD5PMH0_9CRUS|nr:hypothetical protein GHT06_007136 [Daphnia sinensis]
MEKIQPITAGSAANVGKAPPSAAVETSAPSGDPEVDTLANKQYIEDRATDRDNELAQMFEMMECEVRKAKHERAIITAQYNGWLAASLLKLPRCAKLQAFGQTAVVIQCKAVNVTFETVVTPCGPQPKFNNYTINLDGWELVKYSPCYWTNGFVNFNDKPYAYRNNTWKKVDPNIVLPEHTVAHSFRYDDVKSFNYDHRSNPAYSDNLLNHMNVMADIVAAMNEHPPSDFSLNHRPDTTNVLLTAAGAQQYTSWWETIKICHRFDSLADENCQLCHQFPETDEHLVIYWPLRIKVWSWLEGTVRRHGCKTPPENFIRGDIGPTRHRRTIFTLVAAYIYATWKERSRNRIPTEVEVENLWVSILPPPQK